MQKKRKVHTAEQFLSCATNNSSWVFESSQSQTLRVEKMHMLRATRSWDWLSQIRFSRWRLVLQAKKFHWTFWAMLECVKVCSWENGFQCHANGASIKKKNNWRGFHCCSTRLQRGGRHSKCQLCWGCCSAEDAALPPCSAEDVAPPPDSGKEVTLPPGSCHSAPLLLCSSGESGSLGQYLQHPCHVFPPRTVIYLQKSGDCKGNSKSFSSHFLN